MKKLRFVFVFLLAIVVFPLAVFAEEESVATIGEDSEKVNVYLFRGEGCPHCQEAEEWFQSIEEEYGSYFQVVDYETWNDESNAELMQRVADARGETAEGVPYIIIGNKSWNGFAESYENEIIEQIKAEYATDKADRYDIMKLLPEAAKKKKKNDTPALIITLVIIVGLCFGVYKARQAVN